MIFLSIFLNLFLAQIVIGLIVVICLKKVLDHQLLDMAYRQIDYAKPQDNPSLVIQVTVISHKTLSFKNHERFRRISVKRLGSAVKLDFVVDKKILGGAIVKIGEKVFDYSLKDRLRQALSYK